MHTIGFDIGTTTLSAVVVNSGDGTVLHAVTVPSEPFLSGFAPYARVQDATAILDRAVSMIDELCDAFAPIAAIGITGQMHGILYVDADGNAVGSGMLYIHNPLRITGYAGVVSAVNTAENRQVYAGNSLFTLRDTAYSANYESVLKNRREKEEDLMALLGMYSAGAVTAPFDGSVSSIDYSDKTTSSSDNTDSPAGGGGMVYGGMMTAYTSFGSDGSDSSGDGSSSSGSTAASGETKLLTLSSDTSMKLTVSVDETDILSVQNGQKAQITVSTIGDEVFSGVVTAVERSAKSNYGITSYSVEITLDKDPRMLPGMTAKALIRIEGVDNALLIPEKALRQTRDSSFVYTTYDPATGTLGGETAVIPGLTGGGMVEITEGLTEGQTVYYQEAYDPYAYYYGTDGRLAQIKAGCYAVSANADNRVTSVTVFATETMFLFSSYV